MNQWGQERSREGPPTENSCRESHKCVFGAYPTSADAASCSVSGSLTTGILEKKAIVGGPLGPDLADLADCFATAVPCGAIYTSK